MCWVLVENGHCPLSTSTAVPVRFRSTAPQASCCKISSGTSVIPRFLMISIDFHPTDPDHPQAQSKTSQNLAKTQTCNWCVSESLSSFVEDVGSMQQAKNLWILDQATCNCWSGKFRFQVPALVSRANEFTWRTQVSLAPPPKTQLASLERYRHEVFNPSGQGLQCCDEPSWTSLQTPTMIPDTHEHQTMTQLNTIEPYGTKLWSVPGPVSRWTIHQKATTQRESTSGTWQTAYLQLGGFHIVLADSHHYQW